MLNRTLKIEICDDMPFTHDEVKLLIDRYERHHDIEIVLTHSFSGEELLEKNLKDYDLILLDVEMDGIDGYETARRIRQQECGNSVIGNIPIIMITAAEHSFKEAFKIQAFRFVTKPINYKEFESALEDASAEVFSSSKLDVVIDDIHCDIRQKDIVKLTVYTSYVVATLKDGREGTMNISMTKLEEMLDAKLFVRVNRNVTVNLTYVAGIDKSKMKLMPYGQNVDNEELSISVRRVAAVKQAFIKFDLG